MVDEFAKRFRNENKKVDLNLMLEKYLHLFPDTALPKPKEKKKPKSPKDGKISPKGGSLSSKKSGKSSLRSSLPKSTDGEKTSLRKSKEEVGGSQTTSLKDEKRESGQPEQVVEEGALRTSLDVELSRKRVSFVVDYVDQTDIHIEDPLMLAADEKTENIVKDDAVSEHGVQENAEGTTNTEIVVIEMSTTANTLETDNPVVDDSLVVGGVTATQSVDNTSPNENEQNTENVSTMATEDQQS